MTTSTYTTIVTRHNTMRFQNSHGSVSIRKDGGRYKVVLEDYVDRKVIRSEFKTLLGAEINFNYYRRYYL